MHPVFLLKAFLAVYVRYGDNACQNKAKKSVPGALEAKPEVVLYFGLLLDKSTVWVDESEKRVTAIFLLPVWPIEPPERSFLRYSGLYCRRIAHRRLEMLSIRTLGAQNLNLGPEVQSRNRKYIQKCPKWSEMP